jgi:hypothetical protein
MSDVTGYSVFTGIKHRIECLMPHRLNCDIRHSILCLIPVNTE